MFILTRSRALFCVILLWAGVYLPALGTLEIHGEEGRRLLVGIEMLKNGDWIVPEIGGKPYLRKPPMINWVTAISQDIGGRNEWAARAPSALAVLLLGVMIVLTCTSWLGPVGALLAAVFSIGNVSMIEKGRLAEIEALYIVFTGMAVVWWATQWVRKESPWRIWIPTGVFLGLGMLTKGPLHLVFFYSVVIGVMWAGRRLPLGGWRGLLHPAHWLALMLMAGIFGLWAIPHLKATAELGTGNVWIAQFANRVSGEDGGKGIDWADWFENFPSALLNFSPWILLLPLLWRRGVVEALTPRMGALFLGMRGGMVFSFIVVLIAPASSSRFVMPLLVVPSLLLTIVLVHSPSALPGWLKPVCRRGILILLGVCAAGGLAVPVAAGFTWQSLVAGVVICAVPLLILRKRRYFTGWSGLSMMSIAILVLCALVYAAGVTPKLKPLEEERPAAEKINEVLPPGALVTVFNPGFQPFIYYLREPLAYAVHEEDITAGVGFVLVHEDKISSVVTPERPVHGEPLARIPDKNGKPMVLIELAPEGR